MLPSTAIIAFLLVAVCHIEHVSAARVKPHSRPKNPQNHVQYTPVDPSTFSDYENRGMTQGAQIGDWVQHGTYHDVLQVIPL